MTIGGLYATVVGKGIYGMRKTAYLAGAYPKDKRKRMVSLGLVFSSSKAGAMKQLKRQYGNKYRKYKVV